MILFLEISAFRQELEPRGLFATVESVPAWSPTCNGSVHVHSSSDATTSDAGGLVLREALDTSGMMGALEYQLVDPWDPLRIRHSLASQLRTVVLQRAMGWCDTDVLNHDPLWQLVCSDTRSLVPLEETRPSQATLSRLINCLNDP